MGGREERSERVKDQSNYLPRLLITGMRKEEEEEEEEENLFFIFFTIFFSFLQNLN